MPHSVPTTRFRRRAGHLPAVLAACLVAAAAPAAGPDASAWVAGHGSRVRLVAGAGTDRERWAGVEIGLDPGFKTYWRDPGESGLPPAFDWSRSENVAGLELSWPAPARFEDGGGVSYGYTDGVVLPVRVRPRDPGRPVRLALRIDYGVCRAICIPANADLALELPEAGDPPTADLVRAARERVPEPAALDAPGPLAILAVAPEPAGGRPGIAVTVRAPAGTAPQLFAEGPEGWFLATPDRMTPSGEGGADASGTFRVEVERPPAPPAGARVRLTLVAGGAAVETTVDLDADRLSP